MKTLVFSLLLLSSVAFATPSTTYWAPTTATCQAWAVPHITYDTYFGRGPNAGSAGSPGYPVDTGLTVGFLPYEKVQGELGYDLLLPTDDPLLLNAKICTPEGSLFSDSPALSFGVFNFGFKQDVNNYDVLNLMLQKSLPWGGYIAAGVYHGTNTLLFTNSEGNLVQTGFMGALTSPDIAINLKGLKKINFISDIQTGKNALGGGGVGTTLFFTDNISLITGPVWLFDQAVQPGGRGMLWTA